MSKITLLLCALLGLWTIHQGQEALGLAYVIYVAAMRISDAIEESEL